MIAGRPESGAIESHPQPRSFSFARAWARRQGTVSRHCALSSVDRLWAVVILFSKSRASRGMLILTTFRCSERGSCVSGRRSASDGAVPKPSRLKALLPGSNLYGSNMSVHAGGGDAHGAPHASRA